MTSTQFVRLLDRQEAAEGAGSNHGVTTSAASFLDHDCLVPFVKLKQVR